MSRHRRVSSRSNLRAFSGSEGEEESFLENRVKLKRTRNLESIARLDSASNSHTSASNTKNSSNHVASSHHYSTSSNSRAEGSTTSFSSYPLNTPTGVYDRNQRTLPPESPQVDLSIVQCSTIDRFRWVVWRYVYLLIIRSMSFDVWLLSRLHSRKYKAILIFLLPLILYLLYSTWDSSNIEIFSRPFDLVSSTVSSFASFVYSVISSPFIYSQKILEMEVSSLCPDWSFLPTISGFFSYLSNFFVKTEESTTFISHRSHTPQDSVSQSSNYKANREEFRSLAGEVLDERFNDLINNFYTTKVQYEILKSKEDTANKFQKEISNLHLQFQSLSGLVKQLEKDVQKREESSASIATKNIEFLSKEHAGNFQLLNEKMASFEAKLESLGSVKKCCDEKMTPSDFMASLEKHLVTAFRNVVEENPNSPYYFFNEWLNSKLADNTKVSSEINLAFEKLKTQLKPEARQDRESLKVIEGIVQHYVESLKTNLTFISKTGSSIESSLSVQDMRKIAKEAIMLYDADKTGLVDYALESAGGSVLGTRCSESYTEKHGKISVFGLPLWSDQNSPRTAIQPNVQPGECWAFKGSQGFLVIQLSYVIYPTGFTLEHIPVSISPPGSIDSAPKDFSVWGLASESDNEGVLLGKYSYEESGEPLQYFPVQNLTTEPIYYVELKIHSNQGNVDYTCLYRFRVHGTRVK